MGRSQRQSEGVIIFASIGTPAAGKAFRSSSNTGRAKEPK